MNDAGIRAAAANAPVPEYETTPFVTPPLLRESRIAIVTTGALHSVDEQRVERGDHSFRVITRDQQLHLANSSANYDRSGWLIDPNVIFPLDRLEELARDGVIGSVAPRHISFAGNQPDATLAAIRIDSGPAAAALLSADDVDVALLTPV